MNKLKTAIAALPTLLIPTLVFAQDQQYLCSVSELSHEIIGNIPANFEITDFVPSLSEFPESGPGFFRLTPAKLALSCTAPGSDNQQFAGRRQYTIVASINTFDLPIIVVGDSIVTRETRRRGKVKVAAAVGPGNGVDLLGYSAEARAQLYKMTQGTVGSSLTYKSVYVEGVLDQADDITDEDQSAVVLEEATYLEQPLEVELDGFTYSGEFLESTLQTFLFSDVLGETGPGMPLKYATAAGTSWLTSDVKFTVNGN